MTADGQKEFLTQREARQAPVHRGIERWRREGGIAEERGDDASRADRQGGGRNGVEDGETPRGVEGQRDEPGRHDDRRRGGLGERVRVSWRFLLRRFRVCYHNFCVEEFAL